MGSINSAIDTNVLLDVLIPHSRFAHASLECLESAARDGSLLVGEMVFAELSAHFPTLEALRGFLEAGTIAYVPSDHVALHEAGMAWKTLCARRDAQNAALPRHVVADLLIGAHARRHAHRLITRDRGFYRDYFHGLTILDPSVAQPPR